MTTQDNGDDIRALYDRVIHVRDNMIAAELRLAASYREVRKHLPDEQDYQDWLKANNLPDYKEHRLSHGKMRKIRFIDVPGPRGTKA